MKKAIILLAIIGCSCTAIKPVQMHYVVNLADHGVILCRDYSIKADTIFLWDAGRLSDHKFQRNVTNSKAIGFKEVLIVEIK